MPRGQHVGLRYCTGTVYCNKLKAVPDEISQPLKGDNARSVVFNLIDYLPLRRDQGVEYPLGLPVPDDDVLHGFIVVLQCRAVRFR